MKNVINKRKKEVLDKSICTYMISDQEMDIFKHHEKLFGGKYVLNYSDKLGVLISKKSDKEVCVIGYAIDSHGQIKKDEIPNYIMKELERNGGNIVDTYNYCNRLAGKYFIMIKYANKEYLFGDATCTLQVFYSFKNGFAVSCLEKIVADSLGLSFDDRNMRIRKASKISQAMPNDITVYDSLYALLPNHYLDISQQKAVRVPCYGNIEKYEKYSENEILEMSYKRIKNIVKAYNQDMELMCPLTAGRDSRACYGLLKQVEPYMQTYTFIHEGFTEKTPDYKIPLELNVQGHKFIKDMEMPKEEYEDLKNVVGEFIDKKDVIDNAYTFREAFGDATCINGDILDQVGSASIFCGIPVSNLTPRYLTSKIHNKSPEAVELTKKWKKDISTGDYNYLADIYSIESRLGRWGAQWYTAFGLVGSDRVNFFNCREVLMMWIAIPELDRISRIVREYLHKKTLTISEQSVPYNGGFNIVNCLEKRPKLYYVASYLRYLIKD